MEIIASSRGSTSRIGIAIVPIIGLIFFLINLTLLYPGNYIFDSQDQLAQALSGDLNDWHPPMMAVFWHLLIDIFGTASALLVFQLGLYWLGLGLIADALAKRVGLGMGLMVLLAGVFPLFLYINGLLTKDSEMGSAFLAAFGLLFWHRLQKRPLAIPTVVAAAALLAYGVLVRSNSIFAFGPIVLYFLYSRKPSGYIKTVLLSAVLAVAALAASSFVNHRLIAAKQTEPIRSLQLFDIVGVAKLSGDRQWINQLLPIGQEQLDACYTPFWWDSIAPSGKCHFIAGTVMNEEFKPLRSDRDIKPASAKLMGLWLQSIMHHPFIYAEHRIKHFNAELNFFVPSLVCRFAKDNEARCQIDEQDPEQHAQHLRSEIKRDYVRKNIAFWPVTWFVAGLGLLVALRRRNDDPASTAVAARVLAASGSLYGGAYLLVGVAPDARYMYWTMLAAMLACLIGYRDVKQVWAARDRPTLVAAGLIVMVLLLGFVARIADIQTMMR